MVLLLLDPSRLLLEQKERQATFLPRKNNFFLASEDGKVASFADMQVRQPPACSLELELLNVAIHHSPQNRNHHNFPPTAPRATGEHASQQAMCGYLI